MNKMNVLIIGANGQIGRHIVQKVEKHTEHTPIAMVRKTEQQENYQDLGIHAVIGNLEGTVEELASLMENVDTVIFTAGSGGHTGADKTMMIDFDGAIKSMEAAKQANVNRYIIVSAIGVHDRNNWMSKAPYYSAAKHYADEWLRKSGLHYTIIRPGGLTNDEGSGKVKISAELDRGDIPREDVANVITACLEDERTINQSFDLTSGNETIEEALTNL